MNEDEQGNLSGRLFYLLLFTGILINATGLFSPIIEPDSALYAAIAKHMALTNDWINLYGDGGDWLDKPHFPFWMAAISFKLLGISAFSYKLASFIFWLIGIRFTYLLARSLYSINIARYAVLIYITALHAVIANFDVRAEPYLTCCITASIYYIFKMQQQNKIQYLLAAAFFTACAVMTKGIFILSGIGGGFIIYWILNKDWKQLVHYKWWLLVLLTFIFILPELYALYVQFDMHPEKIVFGHSNVSGIKFFFWDSQFGRFFNTGPIKGSGDPSFFIHTFLWAFLPWSPLFVVAVIQVCRRKIFFKKEHSVIYASAAILFLLFSFSRFQLPHYIVILFPQFAMITASYADSMVQNKKSISKIISLQTILVLLVAVFCIGLAVFCGFVYRAIPIVLLSIACLAAIVFFKTPVINNVFKKTMLFALILYPCLNLYFYPAILKYQSGMQAAYWMKANRPATPVTAYKTASYSLEFYSAADVSRNENEGLLRQSALQHPVILYTTKAESDSLALHGFNVQLLQLFQHFPISKISLKFINPQSRPAGLKTFVLASVSVK